jgi:hypothetical protein
MGKLKKLSLMFTTLKFFFFSLTVYLNPNLAPASSSTNPTEERLLTACLSLFAMQPYFL